MEKQMPKISVIIPVFRAEDFLHRSLKSLLSQTFNDWEAICVNDASSDNSAGLLKQWAKRDSRIRIKNLTKNVGPATVRNIAMDMAQGEFIMFLDADDAFHPQTMEIALYLAQRDKSDIVTWRYDHLFRAQVRARKFFGLDFENTKPISNRDVYNLSDIKSVITDKLFNHVVEWRHTKIKNKVQMSQVWKFCIRREFLKGINFPDGLYVYEDVPWWMNVVLHKPRTTITQLPLYYYFPNFKSLLNASKEYVKFVDLCKVLYICHDMLCDADTEARDAIRREVVWGFLKIAIHSAKKLDDTDIPFAREQLVNMRNIGILDGPYDSRAKKVYNEIVDFIK
jgi:glycosyltransferase involved in cell wall biosynthesis